MESHNLLGGVSHQQFLDEYWQQKPLLVRQAFSNIAPPFSVEELAGLCCDTESSGRLIIEKGDTPWQVIQSPLEEEHFLNLPDSHWTLLVNDLERYYPEHLALLENFRFIPDWRIDDLMVSYAPEGGSVGPHIDQYDVFLIQAQGKRHWMLDPAADSNEILPDIELKILEEFNTQQEWTLEAGDMLYLPPNLAHYGVAKNDCMTYSVGFRSPSQQELLESWLYELAKKEKTTARYKDAGRKPQTRYGEIQDTDIDSLKKHLLQAITGNESGNDELFKDWLGRYLTEPKNTDQEEYLSDEDDFINDKSDISYFRSPNTQIAWIKEANRITLFIDGQSSNWSIETQQAIEFICANYEYSHNSVKEYCKNKCNQELFDTLIDQGDIQEV